MTSTAAAANVVANTPGSTSAAICSKMCLQMFEGLELLEEGIQAEKSNFTRFYVLAKDSKTTLPVPPSSTTSQALLRIEFRCRERNVGDVAAAVNAIELGITRIDRRPALNRNPFNDVYFVELQDSRPWLANTNGGDVDEDGIGSGKAPWNSRVESAIQRVSAIGGEVKLLGIW
ncbi:prephenate dehydratase [Marasmius tenuissimus]|uniref:Prephenate dehydratase n=1 Tax=Marasmius tenuissimus TaxID=585030 RepID=A0ABR3A976_9AGAR